MTSAHLNQTFIDDTIYSCWYQPDSANRIVLICPPFGEERNTTSRTINALMRRLHDDGMAAIVFDYPGMGESTGDVSDCTLDSSVRAGEKVLMSYPGKDKTLSILGIRSGCFAAVQLANTMDADLICWQPYITGKAFLKELTLKARIRGALVNGGEETNCLLNGRSISDVFSNELKMIENLFEPVPASVNVMQLSPGKRCLPHYNRLDSSVCVTCVRTQPFWNAHDRFDPDPVIDATLQCIKRVEQ